MYFSHEAIWRDSQFCVSRDTGHSSPRWHEDSSHKAHRGICSSEPWIQDYYHEMCKLTLIFSSIKYLGAKIPKDYEQTVLTALSTLPPSTHSNITVMTPSMHLFSPTTNTQIYSDLPSSLDLKSYVLKHASSLTHPQCQRLGHALGLWTNSFHSWAQADEQKGLVEAMKGNMAMRDLKFTINYDTLVQTVERFPGILEGSRKVFEKVREQRRKDMESEGMVLIHGDFWSGK